MNRLTEEQRQRIKDIRFIAFDLDGTLIDSVPDLAEALRMMLAELGKPTVTNAQVAEWIGNGGEILVKRALSQNSRIDPTLSDELYLIARERFDFHYEQNGHAKTFVYDGVKSTLAELQTLGCQMAIVTNKPAQFVPAILKDLQLAEYFSEVIGGDTLPTNKPNPEGLHFLRNKYELQNHQMMMVGDSKNDILAAKNAKITSVGLTYGYNYGVSIRESEPDFVFDRFDSLLMLFKSQ